MTLRVLVRNGTNHRKLVPCYLIISLAKMFRYGPPGPKFLESTSLQGAWTHFSFVETGNDWRTNEVHSTPYENKSYHPWLFIGGNILTSKKAWINETENSFCPIGFTFLLKSNKGEATSIIYSTAVRTVDNFFKWLKKIEGYEVLLPRGCSSI